MGRSMELENSQKKIDRAPTSSIIKQLLLALFLSSKLPAFIYLFFVYTPLCSGVTHDLVVLRDHIGFMD